MASGFCSFFALCGPVLAGTDELLVGSQDFVEAVRSQVFGGCFLRQLVDLLLRLRDLVCKCLVEGVVLVGHAVHRLGFGEFFFCFYDAGSTFGIDNQAGFDIITDNTTTELKKLGSNFTDEALFDGYAESEEVDRLMVIHPVSNAKKPLQRSKYACVPTTEWRKAFYHRGKAGTLALVG